MIHLQDRDSLARMLGNGDVPDSVELEYGIRQRMYHSEGGSGPLGAMALISMLRFLGLGPDSGKEVQEQVNWLDIPDNGTVRVEAEFYNEWAPGTYLGIIEHGTLAVRLDCDPLVRECRPDKVRLSTRTDRPSAVSEAPAAAVLYEPKQEPAVEPEVAIPDNVEASPVDEVVETSVENGDEPAESVAAASTGINWAKVNRGDKVWVEDGGDYVDGEFIAWRGEMVCVKVAGSEREVQPDLVTYAG